MNHLRALFTAAGVADIPLSATGSPDRTETLVDLRTVRKVFEKMKPRTFTDASRTTQQKREQGRTSWRPYLHSGTIKTHDRHFELVQAILVHGAGKTRNARRKLRLALRRAQVHPEA